MTEDQVERLIDAWYILRDVVEETDDNRVRGVLDALHSIIDAEVEG